MYNPTYFLSVVWYKISMSGRQKCSNTYILPNIIWGMSCDKVMCQKPDWLSIGHEWDLMDWTNSSISLTSCCSCSKIIVMWSLDSLSHTCCWPSWDICHSHPVGHGMAFMMRLPSREMKHCHSQAVGHGNHHYWWQRDEAVSLTSC